VIENDQKILEKKKTIKKNHTLKKVRDCFIKTRRKSSKSTQNLKKIR